MSNKKLGPLLLQTGILNQQDLEEILEQARKTDHQSSYALGQSVAPFHQDLINTTIAHSVARSGDLGLATTLQAQLQRQLRTVGPSSPESVPPSPLP